MDLKKGKKELINKANSTMVGVVAGGVFLIVFSLVASKTLWAQRSYKARVITKKESAVKQLDDNKVAVEKLRASYTTFNGTPDNIIGGNPDGAGDRDGSNSKIILDALPSKYDFPALITSVKKLLLTKGLEPQSVTGTDDEVTQSTSSNKDPIEISFGFTSKVGSFAKAKDLLLATEQSIRPIKVTKTTITGGDSQEIQLNIDAVTYYQATKGLTITKEVVKEKEK